MKIQVELELNDAMSILAAFSPDSKSKKLMKQKGVAALARMAEQVDGIIEGYDNQAEQASYH